MNTITVNNPFLEGRSHDLSLAEVYQALTALESGRPDQLTPDIVDIAGGFARQDDQSGHLNHLTTALGEAYHTHQHTVMEAALADRTEENLDAYAAARGLTREEAEAALDQIQADRDVAQADTDAQASAPPSNVPGAQAQASGSPDGQKDQVNADVTA